MGLDGCGKCMKYTMFAANVLILIGGIVVLAIGIWACADKSSFESLLGSDLFMSAAYILIAAGCFVIIISMIGCLGAIKEIKCLLLTYFIILFIIFVVLLVGGILGYVFRNQARDKMKTKFEVTLKHDYGIKAEINETWDALQNELQCCGLKTDNETHPHKAWLQSQYRKLPPSCCTKKDNGDYNNLENCQSGTGDYHKKDCLDEAANLIEKHALILGGVGIGIACLLILGMVFAIVLFKLIE